MQAQRESAEPEPDDIDCVVFRPKGNKSQFRVALISFVIKIFKPLMITAAVVDLIALLLGIAFHSPSLLYLFMATAPLFLVSGLVLDWAIKKLSGPLGNPIMRLSPDGFTLQTDPFLGTILWDEIASVAPGSLLGFPYVRIMLKNEALFRNRLGKNARFMWMYAMPGGGLGIPCTVFGMSPVDLAARINRYRERGL